MIDQNDKSTLELALEQLFAELGVPSELAKVEKYLSSLCDNGSHQCQCCLPSTTNTKDLPNDMATD
jgi:hypothetical protein